MRKFIFLITMFLLSIMPIEALQAQSRSAECISKELDGSLTLRVWGKGRNKADAIEQAKKNAVYEVVFNGAIKGTKGYELRPLVTAVNAREKYRDYFDIFFMDGGEYLKYVSMADRRAGSTVREKGTTQVSCQVTVRVLASELRTRLMSDNVIKTK